MTPGFTGGQEAAVLPPSRRVSIVRLPRGMPATLMIDQAAEMLGVSRRTVYYRIREGRLRTVRTPCCSQRVLVDSIVALMREERAPRGPGAGVSSTDPCEKSPAP